MSDRSGHDPFALPSREGAYTAGRHTLRAVALAGSLSYSNIP